MSPSSSDSSASASAAAADSSDSKRTAWSRIESEASPVTNESTHVMGADSWPALGESATKSATKFGGSASTSVHVAANNQLRINNPNPNPNSKRIGSSPPLPPMEIPQKISDNYVGQSQDISFKNTNNSSSKGSLFSPNSHGGSDHHQRPHKPFNRRSHNGGAPHNGGGRPHMPPPPPPSFVHQPQFIRSPPSLPPAGAVSFVGPPPPPPPPIRPFMAPPMGFPEMHSPIYYVTGPPLPPYIAAHPVVHAIPPPGPMNAAILKQIEYYFSNDNLVKDTYLRKHMDAEGWVPVALIAGFNRVKQITCNISNSTKFILDLVQNSELVEVQGEKIRRRGDWRTWILPAVPDAQTNGGSKEGTHG